MTNYSFFILHSSFFILHSSLFNFSLLPVPLHQHHRLISERLGQLDASQLKAAQPIANLACQRGFEYGTELLLFGFGVAVATTSTEAVKFLIVEVLYRLGGSLHQQLFLTDSVLTTTDKILYFQSIYSIINC